MSAKLILKNSIEEIQYECEVEPKTSLIKIKNDKENILYQNIKDKIDTSEYELEVVSIDNMSFNIDCFYLEKNIISRVSEI